MVVGRDCHVELLGFSGVAFDQEASCSFFCDNLPGTVLAGHSDLLGALRHLD